ncbi:MAG TPA: DEAD/DEAH box helicase family protein [Candidatus Bathyarchaeia archaeon]|nr:DEAD/DEAH box helicase family protein [Candidatus Bathyarchaeia archaeon]
MIRLWFDKGTLLVKGEVGTPYGKWDPRVGCYRIKALHYRDVLSYLKESALSYLDEVPNPPPLQTLKEAVKLRPYQEEALSKWQNAGMRGVLVLPTAAGKTFIALKAISFLKTQTLIVVPTLDLIDQWRKRVNDHLGIEAGAIGGGEENVQMVTVSTYDSAYLQAEVLGNRFMFTVFDEVHHLASPGYMQIAEMYIAPYRMGLTATYERSDQRHALLPTLVGDLAYVARADELAGKHLSPYVHEKMYVDLTPEEQRTYDKEMGVFNNYLRERRIVLRSIEDFHKFIMATGRDRRAREALLARNRAIKVALNSEAKLSLLAKQLENNRNEKTIIFTLHNDLVYVISRRFLIPALTYQTPKQERRDILENFRTGDYKTIVTSQVLDEGVDVPDASVGFILSGTGSTREYVQRLGRLLRKVEGKRAKLVEIVSKKTMEIRISRRRRQKTGEEA